MLLTLTYFLFSLFSILPTSVYGFDFNSTNPTECGQLTVTWAGGTPPFHLLIITPLRPLQNISIPDTSFNSETQEGEFTLQRLEVEAGKDAILAMGDATGDTSGGIKRAVMVNPRGSNPACLGTPRVDFIFRVDGRLTQCGDFIFTGYTNATKPVTVRAYIPGGESEVTEPKTDDSFNWNMALRAGTPVLFYMTDSDGRNGGVSDLMTVGSSTDDSCLKPASGAGNKDSEDGEGLSVGVIAGAAVGAVVMLIMGILVGVFVIRRRRTKTVQFVQPLMNETGVGYTSPTQGFFHATSHAYAPVPSTTGSMHDRQQSLSYSNSQYSAGGPSSAPFYRKSYGPQAELVQSDAGASSSSSAPGPSQPRVVVHQDISEAQEAVVELPPQYSESLAPIPGLSGEGSSSTSTPIRQGKS